MSPFRCLTWALAIAACNGDATASSAPAAAMLGHWQYVTPVLRSDGPSLNAGLLVILAIDSADGANFGGRVESWFSGDVGLPPGAFGPIAGRMVTETQAALVIPFVGANALALNLVALVATDVLTVRECWIGEQPGPIPVNAEFVRLDSRGER